MRMSPDEMHLSLHLHGAKPVLISVYSLLCRRIKDPFFSWWLKKIKIQTLFIMRIKHWGVSWHLCCGWLDTLINRRLMNYCKCCDLFWSVSDWTWKGLQEVCFFKNIERVKGQGRAVGDKEESHVSHDRKQEGQSQSAGVYRLRPHTRACYQATSEQKRLIVLVQTRLARDEKQELWQWGVTNIPSITHAPSLIMIKCCQKQSSGIPKSIWHQMGAATCRPSLQHLTEWLMGATEARLSPNPKHKQH